MFVCTLADLYVAWEQYRLDGLVKHLSNLSEWVGELFISNVVYILKEVTRGLVYLDQKGIFHGDIKGNRCYYDVNMCYNGQTTAVVLIC